MTGLPRRPFAPAASLLSAIQSSTTRRSSTSWKQQATRRNSAADKSLPFAKTDSPQVGVSQKLEFLGRLFATLRSVTAGWAVPNFWLYFLLTIDEDLGLSGSTTDKRSGFARLTRSLTA